MEQHSKDFKISYHDTEYTNTADFILAIMDLLTKPITTSKGSVTFHGKEDGKWSLVSIHCQKKNGKNLIQMADEGANAMFDQMNLEVCEQCDLDEVIETIEEFITEKVIEWVDTDISKEQLLSMN